MASLQAPDLRAAVKEATAARVRVCRRCGVSIEERHPLARQCWACYRLGQREAKLRCNLTEKGRRRRRNYANSPKGKLVKAAWDAAHPDRIKVYRERQAAKVQLRPVKCATYLCNNTFIRRAHQGRKTFCDDCIRFFYSPSYWKRRHMPRYWRAAA